MHVRTAVVASMRTVAWSVGAKQLGNLLSEKVCVCENVKSKVLMQRSPSVAVLTRWCQPTGFCVQRTAEPLWRVTLKMRTVLIGPKGAALGNNVLPTLPTSVQFQPDTRR